MKSLIFVCALLVCGAVNGQCVDGKCALAKPVKATAKVVNQSVERSVLLVDKTCDKCKTATKKVVSKAVRPVRKVRGVVKSIRCR